MNKQGSALHFKYNPVWYGLVFFFFKKRSAEEREREREFLEEQGNKQGVILGMQVLDEWIRD